MQTCDRCGYEGGTLRHAWEDGLCPSCKAQPKHRNQVKYIVDGKHIACTSWDGEYDDQERPMLDGELYRPGLRTCGHGDCVNLSHVTPEAVNHGTQEQVAA